MRLCLYMSPIYHLKQNLHFSNLETGVNQFCFPLAHLSHQHLEVGQQQLASPCLQMVGIKEVFMYLGQTRYMRLWSSVIFLCNGIL